LCGSTDMPQTGSRTSFPGARVPAVSPSRPAVWWECVAPFSPAGAGWSEAAAQQDVGFFKAPAEAIGRLAMKD
jgi:hypothetical protein